MSYLQQGATVASAVGNSRIEIDTVQQKFTLDSIVLNQSFAIYLCASNQNGGPFTGITGDNGIWFNPANSGATQVYRYLNGAIVGGALAGWSGAAPVLATGDTLTNLSIEYDPVTNLIAASFTRTASGGAVTNHVFSGAVAAQAGRWAGYQLSSLTGVNAKWFKWVSGPTITNAQASANGQDVTVSANFTPQTGGITAATARLDSIPPGQTLGPFAMALGVAQNYAYTFVATPAVDWQPVVVATDAGGTVSSGTSIAPITIVALTGQPVAPDPLSPIPSISGGPFTVLTGQTLAGVITIQDFDNQSGHTFAISGTDAALFVVSAGQTEMTRELRFVTTPSASVFNITLRATDPNGNQSNLLPVQVTVQAVAPGLPESFRLRANLTQDFAIASTMIACYVDNELVAQIVNIDNQSTASREFRLVARSTGRANLIVVTNVGTTSSPIIVINELPEKLQSIKAQTKSLQVVVGGTFDIVATLESVAGYDLEGFAATWEIAPVGSTVLSLGGGTRSTLADENGQVKNLVTALAAGVANITIASGGRRETIGVTVL
jgi:hypothetical protein